MRTKQKQIRIEIPREIYDPGMRVVDDRCKPYIKQWCVMQEFENGMSIHQLVREAYLQGAFDGWQCCERAAELGLKL